MKGLIQFLREFRANSGLWIMMATVMNKGILLLIKVFVIVYISKEEYGQVAYSIAMLWMFSPFVGFGAPSGLLRYGSVAHTDADRNRIADYAFSAGLLHTLLLMILIWPALGFLSKGDPVIYGFMIILLFRLLTTFFKMHQSAEMRVKMLNKHFGLYDMANSILLLVIAFALTYFFQATGYLIALVIVPILTFVIYGMLYGFPKWNLRPKLSFSKKEFWRYAFLTSSSTIASQLIFFLDIYLIGNLINNEAVAEYNVASLIPVNILLLPGIFIATDFTRIAANYRNREFLTSYYKNYLLIFLGISAVGLLISYFFGEWIFGFLGKEYQPFNLFMVLMGGVLIAIMFRVPLGNIISALGRARFNMISSGITLVVSVILNLWWIPLFGLMGAAYATAGALVFSSILHLAYFLWYLKYACK
ncbi:MAG: oligosaccharide flippase family protein [Weeksellaceae bacterium]|nr:oligosaccharide flippase family protein [Weeksellaceae bacterium]